GIVHRLDKGTSGVMVVAKSMKAHENLVMAFSKHDIFRKYEAITLSSPSPITGTIESFMARPQTNRKKMTSKTAQGKKAITHYKLIDSFSNFSHLELKLETGRTHQIRVHLSEQLNCPIFLDPLYGNPKNHLKKVQQSFIKVVK